MKFYFYALSAAVALVTACGSGNYPKNTMQGADSAADNARASAGAPSQIATQTLRYNDGSTKLLGFAAYDPSKKEKMPLVLVIPEWWGLNDYAKFRATELAKLGYVAMAADMYGDGKTADNPTDAGNLAKPFYAGIGLAKSRFEAAMAAAKTLPHADTSKVAAIGYCFGGAMALNMARIGEGLKGVASFHGNLMTGVPADGAKLKAKLLVCNGGADTFVPADEVAAFKKSMDSVHADYIFRDFPGAVHAFTNPAATEMGKKFNLNIAYNAAADKASWNMLKDFLSRVFR